MCEKLLRVVRRLGADYLPCRSVASASETGKFRNAEGGSVGIPRTRKHLLGRSASWPFFNKPFY
jgi:hypothetical protein